MARKKVEKGIYMLPSGYQVKVTVKGVPFSTFVEGHDIVKARSVLAKAKSDMHLGLTPEKQEKANSGPSIYSLQQAYDETWKHQWHNVYPRIMERR